ncbi:MAG: M15 family metallopeptidase [Leptolyngbyaceae cyanobacterium]
MKPYQQVPIQDCGEPLVPLPVNDFAVVSPHPYQALGAPYGDRSPYWLRQSVVTALQTAQQHLQRRHPGWRIQIFDAYRPLAVQQFMVDYTTHQIAQAQNRVLAELSPAEHQQLMATVYQFWASPSHAPNTPPPHSTGAAIDVSLVDTAGEPIDMGSPIDEISERSYPDHFQAATEPLDQQRHRDRCCLRHIMESAGFRQHPNEWWHFSLGDQLWAWLTEQVTHQPQTAKYGRAVDS